MTVIKIDVNDTLTDNEKMAKFFKMHNMTYPTEV
jgi:hypothetical protein